MTPEERIAAALEEIAEQLWVQNSIDFIRLSGQMPWPESTTQEIAGKLGLLLDEHRKGHQ